MAVGAGQRAVMESAFPIASQDAAYVQEQNLTAQREEIDKRMLTASADEQLRLITEQGRIDTQLQELRGEQAKEQIDVPAGCGRRAQGASGARSR